MTDCWWLRNEDMCLLANDLHLLGFSALRGAVLGHNHAITDPERGDYSESGVRNSVDWYDIDSASMRHCKASHRGGSGSWQWLSCQSLPKRERKGISTLFTRNTTAASTRLERAVVSMGLGPSPSSQLAREPTGL